MSNCETDRRSFLKGGLASAAAFTTLPSFFARAVLAGEPSDRILVLVQLDGGNDGLNSVVPFGDDAYYRARPGTGIRQPVKITDHIGLHPGLGALRGCWDDGSLGIVQGVGYPQPNRSHFESTDIWHTGLTGKPARWNGWLGRALDQLSSADVPGVDLDPGPLSLALVGERVVVPSIANADRFRVQGGSRVQSLLERAVETPRSDATVEFVRRSAQQSYRTATRVESALAGGRGADTYPGSALGKRLWQIARMVESGMGARVYAVRLTGFDTHSRQKGPHALLMRTLGDALAAFQTDLKQHGLDRKVLTMTYSEFGRRVKENRSLGTDHGAAAPLFVMGGAIKAGLHGGHPSLTDLDDGDLKFHTDFRSIYATVLDRWLSVDADAVLGARFDRVAFL
jgi:uncharacterized protein (DUF1501 family)